MYQLREYWYMYEMIVKSPNLEAKANEIGNFQSPDKIAGIAKVPGESSSYIGIGRTCYVEEDKHGGKEWSEFECGRTLVYEMFLPTNNSILDIGITATPELIDSDGDRPTAYFIDNGGSTDLSNIEGTDVWADLFLGDDAPGIPERFRIQYWINAENFRLQTLVLSFYIAPEAINDQFRESLGIEEGDPLEFIFVHEFRPLAEEVPEIKPPVIATMPTPAPAAPTAPPAAATAPPTATASPTPAPAATASPTPAPTPAPPAAGEAAGVSTGSGRSPVGVIAFASTVDGNYDIYLYQQSVAAAPNQPEQSEWGSVLVKLTYNDAVDAYPKISPNNRRILFHTDREGDYEIYVTDYHGIDQTNLTMNYAEDRYASWSPVGKKIVFVSDRYGGGRWALYTMDADGSNQELIAEEVMLNSWSDIAIPVYSPDGGSIAFVTVPEGELHIYNISSKATDNLHEINDLLTVRVATCLNWSPDGLSLIFHGDPDPTDDYHPTQLEIFTIDRDGSNFKQLTDDKDSADLFPLWASDGNTIYYSARYEATNKLFSMDPDGASIERLTTLPIEFSEMTFDIHETPSVYLDYHVNAFLMFLWTGDTYYNLDYLDLAVSAYTAAIRLDPQDSTIYESRSYAYAKLGLHEEAHADAAKARELEAD